MLDHGNYLAQRWDEEGGIVNLYHCAGDGCGFFIRVDIADGRRQAGALRSFSRSGPLAA